MHKDHKIIKTLIEIFHFSKFMFLSKPKKYYSSENTAVFCITECLDCLLNHLRGTFFH